MKRSDARGRTPQGAPAAGGEPPRVGYARGEPGALRVPHDAVNEQVVLAAACGDPEARRRLLREVRPEELHGAGHLEAWVALGEIERRSLDFSLDLVRDLSAGAVDVGYLATVLDARPEAPPNLGHHVEQVHWHAQRIGAAQGPLAELNELFRDLAARPEALAAKARELADALAGARTGGGSVEDPQALCAANRAERAARRSGTAVYPFGLDGFERRPDGSWRVKPGAAPKHLTTLTGVSGSCKSVVAKRVALAQAQLGRTVLYGAWEEESGPVLEHLAWMSLGLDRDLVDEGRLDPADERRLDEEEERICARVKFLRKPPQGTGKAKSNRAALGWMAAEVARTGAHVFVPDLFRMALEETEPAEEEAAFRSLLRLAQDADCHVVAVHQQRLKDVESRPDKRPTREGVKGSAGVIEASTTLIGVHRPGLWKSAEDDKIELIVLKQKSGPWPFSVEFDWDAKRASLTNGREVKYLRPGEDCSDVDSFLGRRAAGGRSRW